MENITDFDFYLKFTKPLILNLPEVSDRVLAAAWVKKLTKDSSGEENIRLSYLKLLLFVLQRKKLGPPFNQHPNELQVLEEFPKDQTLVDVAKNILAAEYKEKRVKYEKRLEGEGGDHPPYISDFSADLLEYVAVQNIDNFGVHAYYAISKLPLNSWYRVDKQLLPKAAKSMLEVSTPPPTLVEAASTPEIAAETAQEPSPQVSPPKTPETPPTEAPPSPEAEPEPQPEPEREPEPEPKKKKESPRKSTLGASPPSRPIGRISPPLEDREPPTWGSNLLEAKFLEEEVGDIVTAAETFAGFDEFLPPGASTGIGEPTEILWSSPPPFGMGDESPPFGLFDESPPFILDESAPYLPDEESVPELWTSAASLPYLTPPFPRVVTPSPPRPPTPSPPRPPPKKVVKKPGPRPTRSSLLLQKKKQQDRAPPPPPPPAAKPPKPKTGRKPPPKPTRASLLAQKKKPAEEEEVEKKPSKTKVARKPPGPMPKPTRASLLLQKKKEAEKAPPPPKKGVAKKPSKGKVPKKPAEPAPPADDIQEFVEEYNRTLGEIEDQYVAEMEETAAAEQAKVEEAKASKIAKPKRQLSRIAKMSRQQIPKSHAAAVELERSIHISPDARQILEGIIEGPSTSTGITHPEPSSIRHPSPKLVHDEEEEEEEDRELSRFEIEGMEDVSDLWQESFPEEDYATMETSLEHSGRGKDPRLVAAFNQMLETSQRASDLERIGLEDLDVDMADISGGNIDQLMGDLQAAVQEPQVLEVQAGPSAPVEALEPAVVLDTIAVTEDDFEAMERMIEDEMRRKGEDPHAKPKRRISRDEFTAGRQRLLDLHHRTDAQMEELVRESIDPEDFEAMEKFIEEEMISKGEDPHAKTKRRISRDEFTAGRQRLLDLHHRTDAQMEELEAAPDFVPRPRKKKVRRPPTVGGRSPLAEIREEDEEEWIPGLEFFASTSPGELERVDTRQKPAEFLFPDIDFSEGADLFEADVDYLPEEFMEEDIPDTDAHKNFEDIDKLYREYYASTPAFADVPVTAPRPTTSPKRLPEAKGGPLPGLLEIPEFVPEDIEDIVKAVSPTSDEYGLVPVQKMFGPKHRHSTLSSPKPGPSWRPDTPPGSPIVEIPTTPSKVLAKYSPEHFRFQYESPEIKYEQLKDVGQVDTAGVSPPRRDWVTLDDVHMELFGVPREQTVPTVFDVPSEKVVYESPPRRLASPVSPRLPPPIDVEALRRAIYAQSIKPPDRPYRKVVVPGRKPIERYSHGPVGIETIPEAEYEPPPGLTAEDFELQRQLQEFEPIRRRRPIRFPNKRLRTLQRHSAAPQLGAVEELYESPEKKVPDVLDLPTVGVEPRVLAESPPREFPSPERGYVSPDQWERRMRIETARPPPRKEFPRRRPPALPTIEEPVEYPDVSPASRFPAPAVSPGGREGPRRRTVRRNLKKRRIDFSQAPTSPDEERVEVTEVQAEVGERDVRTPPRIRDIELSPHSRHLVRQVLGLSPSPERVPEGSPRTPPRDVFLQAEEEPVVEGLPQFSPPGPILELRAGERRDLPTSPRRFDTEFTPRTRHLIRQVKGLSPSPEAVGRTVDVSLFEEEEPAVESLPQFSPPGPLLEVQAEQRRDMRTPPRRSGLELSPRTRHMIRREMGLSPSPEAVGRTIDVSLIEEQEPVVEDLPPFSPPSPMSEYGVLEQTMEEVRRHRPVKWRLPKVKGPKKYRRLKKLSDYYRRFPEALPETVTEESPEKVVPDVFDLPAVGVEPVVLTESPPLEFPSPERRQFTVSPDEWEQRRRIETARPPPRRVFPRGRPPTLPTIPGEVEYPDDSPTSRVQAPAVSPSGREGPRRRTVRRNLKKRRIDFSQAPTSPDEDRVEVTEVQAEVGERDLRTPPRIRDIELSPFSRHLVRQIMGLSPSPERVPEGSPRTPPRVFLHEEEEPAVEGLPQFSPPGPLLEVQAEQRRDISTPPRRSGLEFSPRTRHMIRREMGLSPSPEAVGRTIDVSLAEEEEPVVEDLPPFSPPSPLSEYGVLEQTMEEVRRHEPVRWRLPKVKTPRKYRSLKKLSDYYKRFPEALPETVPEESPEKIVPDVIDLPSVGVEPRVLLESPPPEFPSPERRQFASPDDWEQRRRIEAARPPPRKVFPRSRPPTLSPIGSPVEYPETSPVARTPAPPSPSGREGPRRKTLRRDLKKRRIDFSQAPGSPGAERVPVVERRELPSPPKMDFLEVTPRTRHLIRQTLGLSPESPEYMSQGPPRTPVREQIFLDTEEVPEEFAELTPPRYVQAVSPDTLEFERYEVSEPSVSPIGRSVLQAVPAQAADRVQQLAAAQYAALADTPPRGADADRIQQLAAAQYAALADTPPSPDQGPVVQTVQAQVYQPRTPPRRVVTPPRRSPKSADELWAELMAMPATPPDPGLLPRELRLLPPSDIDRALLAHSARAVASALDESAPPAEIVYEEPVEFQYEEEVVEQKPPKAVKSVKKVAKELKGKDKKKKDEKPAFRPGGAAPVRFPGAQVQEKRPAKKKFKAVSKIDTGRKKKAPPPVVEYDYDLEALQDLGVGGADLFDMNLLDEVPPDLVPAGSPERPFDPLYPRPRVRPSRLAPILPTVTEAILEEEIPEIDEDEYAEAYDELTQQAEDARRALAEESGGSPVISPRQLRAELEAHQIYDPQRKRMKKRIVIGGRHVPLRGARRPGLETVHETTPPRRVMPQIAAPTATDVMAAAAAQYDALLRESPQRPRTPSPEILKRELQQHQLLPYKKRWPRRQAPALHTPDELHEDLFLWSPPKDVLEPLEWEQEPVYDVVDIEAEEEPFYFSPPTSPGEVSVLTVDDFGPIMSPTSFMEALSTIVPTRDAATPPGRYISEEERPSFLEAVSPTTPLREDERIAMAEAGWGGTSPIPEELRGFKWLSPKIIGEFPPRS